MYDYDRLDPKIIRIIKGELAIIGGCIPIEEFQNSMTNERKERFKSIYKNHRVDLALNYMALESEVMFKSRDLPFAFHVAVASLFKIIFQFQNKFDEVKNENN